MDVFDRAQQQDEYERERCIRAARAKALSGGRSLTRCERCAQPIAKERQKAVPGVRQCIDCARALERFSKQFKRT